MSDNNNGNRDYFGLYNIDEFLSEAELESPVEISSDSRSFDEQNFDISFEKSGNNQMKSFNLDPVNLNTPQHNKKKFVVKFDDREDYIPPEPSNSSNPRSRGGIYFSNGRQGNSQHNEQSSFQKNPSQPSVNVHKPPQRPPIKSSQKSVSTKSSSKNKNKKQSSQGGFALKFISTVLIFSLMLSFLGISCLNDVLAIGRDDESVVVTIPTDCTAEDIIDILADSKLIHQKWFCKFFFDLKNKLFNHDPTELEFNSGVYYLKKNLGFEGYLSKFQSVQTTDKTVNVFFPEGFTTYQMFEKLDNFGICKKEELISALQGADYDYSFISNIKSDSSRVFTLEGYLFPDTYEFFEFCDANTIIRKMLSNFESKWTEEYQKRADELGMTMDEVIILASIIQREAGSKDQMKLVSSVLHNRLNHANSYPTLGCDATKNYIEKYVMPNVTSVQGQTYLSAYNTSQIRGLPAGPICNPGIDAIEAALYPEDTNYYYFCHDNSGEIYLAQTNSEHDRNLLEVLRKNGG